jgi:hypothetical protein
MAENPAGDASTTTNDAKVGKEAAASVGSSSVAAVVDRDLVEQQEVVRERVAKAAAQKVVAHLSADERTKKGKVARAQTPREELASWESAANRADPVGLLDGSGDRVCRNSSRCGTPGWLPVHSRSTAGAPC